MDIHVVHGEKYSTVGVCIHECKESTGIHCAMSFYIMEFWYSGRLLEPIPSRCQGTVLLAFEVLILVLNSPLTLEITWPLWTQVLYLLNKIVELLTAIPFSVHHSALEKYKLADKLGSLNMVMCTVGNYEDLRANISHSFQRLKESINSPNTWNYISLL